MSNPLPRICGKEESLRLTGLNNKWSSTKTMAKAGQGNDPYLEGEADPGSNKP
jgi:hypothetical protein